MDECIVTGRRGNPPPAVFPAPSPEPNDPMTQTTAAAEGNVAEDGTGDADDAWAADGVWADDGDWANEPGDAPKRFFGRPVKDYERGQVPGGQRTLGGEVDDAPAGRLSGVAVRVGVGWDDEVSFADKLADLLDDPAAAGIEALVIGPWDGGMEGEGPDSVIEALVASRDRLPDLRALFFGDYEDEDAQISWIVQGDLSPLLAAFPKLEALRVRGAQGLSLGRPSHDALRSLTIETGGMPASLLREVAAARLPKLERLELWFGDQSYGNDLTDADVAALLDAPVVAGLKHLGLRDDDRADATAKLLASRPKPGTITTLDLSLGTLGDEGAAALADCGWVGKLDKLDIHHHYATDAAVGRLRAAVKELDAGQQETPDDWGDGESHRYVAVGE